MEEILLRFILLWKKLHVINPLSIKEKTTIKKSDEKMQLMKQSSIITLVHDKVHFSDKHSGRPIYF